MERSDVLLTSKSDGTEQKDKTNREIHYLEAKGGIEAEILFFVLVLTRIKVKDWSGKPMPASPKKYFKNILLIQLFILILNQ